MKQGLVFWLLELLVFGVFKSEITESYFLNSESLVLKLENIGD